MAYTVRLTKTGFGANATILPNDLILTPRRWSASDRGGMKDCTIEASGTAQDIALLTGWFGDNISIYNAEGDLVWWGILWDMEIILGNAQVNLSLDDLYNRVAVIYPYTLADGTQESRTTDWAEDSNSVAHYGKRELLHGVSDAFRGQAETVRDNILAVSATASPSISTEGRASAPTATLTGRGLWYKSSAVYFTNPDGLIEHTTSNGSMYVGRYLESTQISFGTSTPGGLGTGSEADEMVIASGNFDPLTDGDPFTVSGSTSNDDSYSVDHKDSNIQIAIAGTFTPEAAGATVRVSYGDSVSYSNVAQAFETTTDWTATHVAVKVRQVGNPTDNFRIGIYPDSSGIPGTVLGANETLGSALFTELTWTEFELNTPVALTAGVTYWLAFRRTGTISLADGYEVALDEDLGYADGAVLMYDGATWVTRSPDTDLPFRIIGEIDTTEQIVKAAAVVDDFPQVLVQVDSNIPIRQFVDDERTAMEELETMLDAGTSDGQRLVAWVGPDGTVVVSTSTESGGDESLPMLGIDGRMRQGVGGVYSPGQLVFGRKIEIEGLFIADVISVTTSREKAIYISESEYDAESDTISVRSEGANDPYKTFETRQG